MRNYARLQAVARTEAAAEGQTTEQAAATSTGKTKSKKGITLSLQEFNRSGVGKQKQILTMF